MNAGKRMKENKKDRQEKLQVPKEQQGKCITSQEWYRENRIRIATLPKGSFPFPLLTFYKFLGREVKTAE